MSLFVESGEDRRWFGFLSRWSLFGGVVILGMMLTFSVGVLPAGQNDELPPEYFELAAAMDSPVLYRLTTALDLGTWLALGGFFVALAAILYRRAPVRGVLIAACGIGQISGVIGAYTRLLGTSELAAGYGTAAPDEQEALLRSYSDLQLTVFSHFGVGTLLWSVALLLAASAVWSLEGLPRWLAALIALPGVVELPSSVLRIATDAGLEFLLPLELLLLVVAFFSVSWVFRRRAPGAVPDGAPSQARKGL